MRIVAYCGDHTALTTTRSGDKIYVDTRDVSLAPHIMLEGSWEPWVSNAFEWRLRDKPGATVIDVGANVGWYTLLACRNGASHVYAFEPNPRMVELLKKSVMANGYRDRVTIVEAGCGAKSGSMALSLNPEEAGGAHLSIEPGYPPVDVVTLDEVVLAGIITEKCSPDILIKADVEGYEPNVLRGAVELMARRPVLFLEHHQSSKHKSMYIELLDRGYLLRHATHKGYQSAPQSLDTIMALDDAETVICEYEERAT